MQEPPLQRKRAGSDSFCLDSFISVKEDIGPGGLRTREELLRVINNIFLKSLFSFYFSPFSKR